MFDIYYEVEKMMQLRVQDELYKGKQKYPVSTAKSCRSRRGLLALLIILKEKLK